jgi:hypothetical protein
MRFMNDRLAGPLVRGVARVAGIAWLASQVPQLVLGVSGAALLIVAAARDAVGVLPGAFSWDCVN